MKSDLIFIGNSFVYNEPFKEYLLRNIEKELSFIDTITNFKASDNSLFLYLEEALTITNRVLIVTGKQNFSTIGKILCTITGDNQILKEGMLIPQKATLFEEKSYLLEHKKSIINVIQCDEGEQMPQLLLTQLQSTATMHIFDEAKEDIVTLLNPLAQMYEVEFSVTSYIEGWLRVDIDAKRYGEISKFMHAAKNLLPKKVIASANIIDHIIKKLSIHGKKITFAESCTGGLLSYYFTKHNGASNILDGSLVTYSNALKENWLAVDHQILANFGAVSSEVVAEMSEGALNVSGADYALSISGIAGDGGGTPIKPVGTVYIGVRSKEHHQEKHLFFQGDRNYVQHQSAMMALKMLLLLDKETFF
jgi:nicotinamide-nucleotide amidase